DSPPISSRLRPSMVTRIGLPLRSALRRKREGYSWSTCLVVYLCVCGLLLLLGIRALARIGGDDDRLCGPAEFVDDGVECGRGSARQPCPLDTATAARDR